MKEHFRNQFHQTLEIAAEHQFATKQPEPKLLVLDSTNPNNIRRSGRSPWYVSVINEEKRYLRHSFYRYSEATGTNRHVVYVEPAEENTVLATHAIADAINSEIMSPTSIRTLKEISECAAKSTLVEVRLSTAAHPWLPQSAAETLMFDTDHEVREVLANNPCVSDRIRVLAASQL